MNKLKEKLNQLSLIEYNYLLFRCPQEEENPNFCYDIPKHGRLIYNGIVGVTAILENIRKYDDMGHPLFHNLR
jgi:glycogen debranching enzyme